MIEIGINPIAFSIGSVQIGWYGIMVTLAVITVVTWSVVSARKDSRINGDMILNAALVGIPSGIIFARLLHVIDQWDFYMQNPGRIIGGDGLTIWGAVLGAALGIWIYNRFSKHSFAHMADLMAPGIILSQAVGRIGCTILGDDYGLATNLPWGFIYTHPGSPANQALGITVATHPVVVYEIIYNLIIFGVLLLLRKRLKPDGSLFMAYLAFYAIWRIGSDFLREGTDFLFGLHQAQFIGVVVLIFCVVMMAWKTRWVKKGELVEPVVEENKEEKPTV